MRKAQVIKEKCCGRIFAACIEPNCYTDKDWLKDLRKYVLQGHTVEMMPSKEVKIELCNCKKKQTDNQLQLFN